MCARVCVCVLQLLNQRTLPLLSTRSPESMCLHFHILIHRSYLRVSMPTMGTCVLCASVHCTILTHQRSVVVYDGRPAGPVAACLPCVFELHSYYYRTSHIYLACARAKFAHNVCVYVAHTKYHCRQTVILCICVCVLAERTHTHNERHILFDCVHRHT
jgi:hypothetical protein